MIILTDEHFGNSAYKSREVGNAPVPPLSQHRLQMVDTGLLNFAAGLQAQYFGVKDLNALYKGILSEHIVAQ